MGVPARHSRSRWFAVDLTRKTAPWVFAKGEPYRVIVALELNTTLVAVMGTRVLTISGATDKQGNAFCASAKD